MPDSFITRVIKLIKRIPKGRVATYGQIAALAGNPRGARQVVRALHSSSDKARLPWFRVVNARGRISLPPGRGFELQQALLERESVHTDETGRIDLTVHQWKPRCPRS